MTMSKVLIAAALAWHATALTLKADPVTAFDLSCYEEADKGAAYRGLLTNTHSGRACQNWLAAKPHNISAAGIVPTTDNGLGNHNYCRNPGGAQEKPWCYTMDPVVDVETCEIPTCPPEGRDWSGEADQLAMEVATGLDCDCMQQLYGSSLTTEKTAVPLVLGQKGAQVLKGKMVNGKCKCPNDR
mmetsp:Transcript_41139/g.94634  ORF Transcript_41139/g.94634 Transcript_41139/m.94634 type:complete len:185 (-) Transcript_41139:69-623(-)